MSVPGTVIYFSMYETMRDLIVRRWPSTRDRRRCLHGSSRLLTATIVSPIELMRTRMQAEPLLREGMVGVHQASPSRRMGRALEGLYPPFGGMFRSHVYVRASRP